MKRQLEADLTDLRAKELVLRQDIRAKERQLETLVKEERKARGVSIPWDLFCKAATKCTQAWRYVALAPEDQAGACEYCQDDCEDDDEWTFTTHGYSARDFHELRPLGGCTRLTLCSYCLKDGRAFDLLDAQKKMPWVRVDPDDYDAKWQERFKEKKREMNKK